MNDNQPTQSALPDPRKEQFEETVHGASYAGLPLRNPKKKRYPSNLTYQKHPEGADLDLMLDVILKIPGEWHTVTLLIREIGMSDAPARYCKWEQIHDDQITWLQRQPNPGEFVARLSPALRLHLDSLPRTSSYVCPDLAMMRTNAAMADFRKKAIAYIYTLESLDEQTRRLLRRSVQRFQFWQDLVAMHDRLALEGKLPERVFKAPFKLDKLQLVKCKLLALRDGKPLEDQLRKRTPYPQYRSLSIDELCSLMKSLDPQWRLIVIVMFYLSISADKLCRMQWSAFDFNTKAVTLPNLIQFPIHEKLYGFLMNWSGPKKGKLIPFTQTSVIGRSAMFAFAKAGFKDPEVTLASIHQSAMDLLQANGLRIDSRSRVKLSAGFGGEKPTEEKKLELIRFAFSKLPDITKDII